MIKAAKIENSPRLQRVLKLLSNGGWYSTRIISEFADVCAVNSAIAEIRANGIDVECKASHDARLGENRYYYRLAA